MDYAAHCDMHGPYSSDTIVGCECEYGHGFCLECSDIEDNEIAIATDIYKEITEYDMLTGVEKSEVESEIIRMTLNEDRSTARNILYDSEYFFNVPPEHCPVCQEKVKESHLRGEIALRYILAKEGMTEWDLRDKIASRFNTYEDLEEYIEYKNSKGGAK